MDRYQKFLSKANKKLRKRIIESTVRFAQNDWSGLDVKPLKGWRGYYRCRIGDIRIIGRKEDDGIIVVDIDWRSSIYNRWK